MNQFTLSQKTQERYALVLERFLEQLKECLDEQITDSKGDYYDDYDYEDGIRTCRIHKLTYAERVDSVCEDFAASGEDTKPSIDDFLEWCCDQLYGNGCHKNNQYDIMDTEIREAQEAAND